MHHLFLVHSPITELVAAAAIDELGLDASEVVLLASRGFEPRRTPHRRVALPYARRPEPFPDGWNPLAGRRRLLAFDRSLEALTGGEPFHFYTPQTSQRFMQLFASSPLCAGFSFLEEGLLSYYRLEELERVEPPRSVPARARLGYAGRIRSARYFEEGHATAYAADPRAFPDLAQRVVLKRVFAGRASGAGGPVECALVLDGNASHGLIGDESVLRALDRALRELPRRGVRRVHYKYPPVSRASPLPPGYEALFAGLAGRLEFTRLGDEVLLEAVARESPGCLFLVGVSSVALYASRAGCRVQSFARYLVEAEPGYAAVLERLPAVFHDSVEYLE